MLGIIGGSGLYDLPGLTNAQWRRIDTPFGPPSDEVLVGTIAGKKVAFLPRHGRGHRIPPSQLNVRANLSALKQLGCTDVLSLSAVGSLVENLPPGTLVLVDQFIDWTKGRPSTFFSEGLVGHVSLAHPTCGRFGALVDRAGKQAGGPWHQGGTYVCIEGPQFSTQAESKLYRGFGAQVIGMTAMPEVKLAREAELCFATVAMVTDFDCWHPDHDAVTAAQVVATFQANTARAKALLQALIPLVAERSEPCGMGCERALDTAVLTAADARSAQVLRRLKGAGLRVEAPPAEANDPHQLKPLIRTVPDWPKKGIQFRDVTTLLEDAQGLRRTIDALTERYRHQRLDAVVGIDARGFILGGALAVALGVGFVPVRKKGKLPGTTLRVEYALEYGTDTVEIGAHQLGEGKRVVVVDDLIATGGTASAAVQLARLRGAEVVETAFIVELPELQGRAKLEKLGAPVFALCEFGGH